MRMKALALAAGFALALAPLLAGAQQQTPQNPPFHAPNGAGEQGAVALVYNPFCNCFVPADQNNPLPIVPKDGGGRTMGSALQGGTPLATTLAPTIGVSAWGQTLWDKLGMPWVGIGDGASFASIKSPGAVTALDKGLVTTRAPILQSYPPGPWGTGAIVQPFALIGADLNSLASTQGVIGTAAKGSGVFGPLGFIYADVCFASSTSITPTGGNLSVWLLRTWTYASVTYTEQYTTGATPNTPLRSADFVIPFNATAFSSLSGNAGCLVNVKMPPGQFTPYVVDNLGVNLAASGGVIFAAPTGIWQ